MPKNHDGRDLCHFTFADGRRCTLPQFPDDYGLCYHHGQKYRASLHAKEAGCLISHFVQTDILTACDLSCALSYLFSSTAQGVTKPKTAIALGYLAQLMIQTQKLAKEEYLEASNANWSDIVRDGPAFNAEFEKQPTKSSPPTTPSTDPSGAPILTPDPPATGADPDSPTLDSADLSQDNVIVLPPNQNH
jgi:hypothetical protein